MSTRQPDLSELWTQHQRRNTKTTQIWPCPYCIDQRIHHSADESWKHILLKHQDKIPTEQQEKERFRIAYLESAARKSPIKDDSSPRKPSVNEASSTQLEPPPGSTKRPLSTPGPPTRSLSGLQSLNIGTPRGSEDVTMQDASEDGGNDQPRKRAAVGDGISAGSASPYRNSESPPPRRSKARPTSAPYGSVPDTDLKQDNFEPQRPQVLRKQLWTPDNDTHLARSPLDPSNIASVQAQKSRAQALQAKNRKGFQSSPQVPGSRAQASQHVHIPSPSAILGNKSASSSQNSQAPSKDDGFDMILQPETRPISQEQLVAEVKGIYAGLVMVEAKCIEVDNKQAASAHTDGVHSKLNNEQWQALIALHRTLLHEHHDFFLASQHPSASPALRRLASKYAMPARMWRHGIHSFLELLRHRLPASLDHMLAFIYLAYTMMALLYETVPAFEDTWIECLGDLARYRMAIEDDDIRDREVWTGVARHWYSKASDKAPTTGRLYHHLAILARPNALQQLFYYAKSLCVVIPFVSARESILTLFEPVLTDKGQGQYRLPPLDAAFVKAHGLLFTGRNTERFEPAVQDFLSLLDNHIGRVTRKFMEHGYYIAVANIVAMLGFASKENVLMSAIESSSDKASDHVVAGSSPFELSTALMRSFESSERLTNATLEIVLQRIGDPNVLPFIHVSLVFMYFMSRHPRAIRLLETNFPWQSLTVMLNTLLAPHRTPERIENPNFPLPVKDDVRPFTEDFALRGILWADNYYPDTWFSNEKIDDEEKYLEVASMTDDRKERILWLACRLAEAGSWIYYDRNSHKFSTTPFEVPLVNSRASTFASATSIDRAETWPPVLADAEDGSEDEEKALRTNSTKAF